MIPLPAALAIARRLPWGLIGLALLAAVAFALYLRGNHYAAKEQEAQREIGAWMATADRLTEIANENAKAAEAAKIQTADAEAKAASLRKQRDAQRRENDSLKEKVKNAADGKPLQPGVRAAISGLRD